MIFFRWSVNLNMLTFCEEPQGTYWNFCALKFEEKLLFGSDPDPVHPMR
jgi:hypothetical protein